MSCQTIETEQVFIAFQGEILEKLDSNPTGGRNDAFKLLCLYENFGDQFLNNIAGHFAFVLWDRYRHFLISAVDQANIRKLYHSVVGEDLVISDSVKGILSHPKFNRKFNYDYLTAYVGRGEVNGPETVYQGIYHIPHGCWVRSIGKNLSVSAYWPPENLTTVTYKRASDYDARFRDKLLEVLSDHLVPREVGKVGLKLSGGLDSSSIAAMAHIIPVSSLPTYSIRYKQKDEEEYRDLILKLTNFSNTCINDFDYLDWWTGQTEEPDVLVNTEVHLALAKCMQKDHITAVIDGSGGDEFMCGYNEHEVVADAESGHVHMTLARMAQLLPERKPYAPWLLPEREPQLRSSMWRQNRPRHYSNDPRVQYALSELHLERCRRPLHAIFEHTFGKNGLFYVIPFLTAG